MKSKLRFLSFVATACLLIFVLAAPAAASLTELQRFTGKVGYSADGFGSTSQAGTISANVPLGATVEAAFLYTSMFGNSTGVGAGGTLNGSAIAYGATVAQLPLNGLSMRRADVTSIVKPIIDAGAGGIYNFAITEDDVSQDGEALVVVYRLASLHEATFAIFDGFSASAGDAFTINFADQLDPTAPGFFAEMFLGIGFSVNLMASTVTVNGTVITNNAGNNDDGVGAISNGQLITVGGYDDPFSALLPTYADDHERYNIVPQITTGDISISVATLNPSNDDNIFLAGFYVAREPDARDDVADTITNQFVDIPVLVNDDVGTGTPLAVTITSGPADGAAVPVDCNVKATCIVTYTPNAGFGGTDIFEYTLTDNDGDSDTAIVTVTVDPSQAVVAAGTGVTVLLCADNPDCPNNPFNWFYPDVIVEGELLTECCAAPAVREVEGDGTGKFLSYNPRDLDIGQLIKNTPDCELLLPLLPEIGDPKVDEDYMPISVVRPWLRVYPNPALIATPELTFGLYNNRDALAELKWAICATNSTAVTNSITVMQEEPENVDGIGFAVDGAENRIAFRPFTSGNSVDPQEGDFAFVLPWTAELDKSGSGRRSSTNIALLTTRADPKQNAPKSMINRLGSDLRDEIVAEDGGDCLAPDLIDDLLDLWKIAKNKIRKAKGDPTKILEADGAVEAIDDLTVKALDFIPRCPDDRNANAVIAGRSMNWSYMTCSYLGHPEDAMPPIQLSDCLISTAVLGAIATPPPGLPAPE